MLQEIKGQGIQSLELGLAILKKIAAEKRPLTITDISQICEMPKSKIHHYLTSFCRSGFLKKGEDLKYTLGSELVLLGLEAADSMDINEMVGPYLKEISDAVNETVFLALWGVNGPFFSRYIESKRAINLGVRVGSQVSVTKSSSGRVFAAFLRNEEAEALIKKELKEYNMDSELFYQELREVREKRYAHIDFGITPGVAGIACPIFNRSNQIIASVTILALSGVLDTSENSDAIRLLKENCLKLSMMLGFKGS